MTRLFRLGALSPEICHSVTSLRPEGRNSLFSFNDRLFPKEIPNRLAIDSLCVSRRSAGGNRMGRPIEITRFELSATELREWTQAGAVVRRLLAIALVLEGHPREAAAQKAERHGSGRHCVTGCCATTRKAPLALNEAQMEELWCWKARILRATRWRWRCADLQACVPLVGQRGRAHGRQAAAPASHDGKTQRPRRLINKTSPAW